jgi:hypothetical protein
MLMTAAGGLACSYEHIRISGGEALKRGTHPAFHGLNLYSYKKNLDKLGKILGAPVSESRLFDRSDHNQWIRTKVKEESDIRPSIEGGKVATEYEDGWKARDVVTVFRNALCHNNIVALGGGDGEIGFLGFFARAYKYIEKNRVPDGFNLVAMPTAEFEIFLENWFEVLIEVAGRKRQGLKILITNSLGTIDEHFAA